MELTLYRPFIDSIDATDFDYEKFRKMIVANGHVFSWQWGLPCPCQGVYTVGKGEFTHRPRSPRVGCEGCGKTPGTLYLSGQQTVGIVSGFGDERTITQFMGLLQPGEEFVTLPPEHAVDHEDRFVDLSVSRPMAELVKRGDSPIIRPRYPIVERLMKLGNVNDPSIFVETKVGLLYATKATSAGVYVPGELTMGTHFDLTADGELDCTPGGEGGPEPGEWVSIRYNAHPVFKVKQVVRQARDSIIVRNPHDGCEVREIGLGPVHVILAPEYRGFRDVEPYNAETA